MSGDRTQAKIAAASIAKTACENPTPIYRAAQSQWRQERLIEARGILADMAHHPDTLVILACRVVCGCSPDAKDRVMRLLSARPSETARAALKGGAA
jgi:hypothetical protein